MSEIDYRYPYPLWIKGYKQPFEARIIPPKYSEWNKATLIVSCINSIELLSGLRFGQTRVVGKLYKAMQLDATPCKFDKTPEWLRLSRLTMPTLVKFKLLLSREIEERMAIYFDKDPEEETNG
jgi:hypothetical protein